MTEIKLFLFVLSTLFVTTYIFTFIARLFQDNPEPMKISRLDGTLLYLSTSFIITYFFIN